MSADQLIADATKLWRAHGGPEGDIRATACAVSGNNRVFVLTSADGTKIVTKGYFRDGDSGHKRLHAEYQFLTYAEQAGISNVPQAIASDPETLTGLYQFVTGRKLAPNEIGKNQILAAADFIRKLNTQSHASSAHSLPDAAEACFSLDAHFALADRRLERLATFNPSQPIDIRAAKLLTELTAFWQKLRQTIQTRASALNLKPDQPAAPHERIISPSDFGFHNALVDDSGALTFIDFEYAGWDDIAKLVSDFFFQPAIPVDSTLFETFMDRVTLDIPDRAATQNRIRLLRPIFGVRWCCIMLNCFLPDMAARRRFANPEHDEAQNKLTQLTKAEAAFHNLTETSWPM